MLRQIWRCEITPVAPSAGAGLEARQKSAREKHHQSFNARLDANGISAWRKPTGHAASNVEASVESLEADMSGEHEMEQFEAKHDDFSRFYDKEFQGEPHYLNDGGIKNVAFVCWLEGMRRAKNPQD